MPTSSRRAHRLGLLAALAAALSGCGPNNAYCQASPFCLPRADARTPYGVVPAGPVSLRAGETRSVTVELVFPDGSAPGPVRLFNVDAGAGDGNPLATPGGDVQVSAPGALTVGPGPFTLVVAAGPAAAPRQRQAVPVGLGQDGRVRSAPYGAVTLELNVVP